MSNSEFGKTLKLGATELYFEDRGQGPALLLLHGFGGTHRDFEHLFDLDELSRDYRLIVPDLRGHGQSTNRQPPLTHRACAEDVLALLDSLALERVSALGVSLGGNTLLHLATRAPARLDAMILVSATTHFPEQARAFMRAAAEATHSPAELAAMRALHVRGEAQIEALLAGPRAFAESTDDLCFDAAELGKIGARTLLVAGDRDPLYPVEISVELFRAIAAAELWIVPGRGHSPIFGENRAEFARIARNFLARV